MSEIRSFVDGVVDKSLSDKEVENWMQHVYDNGLSASETVELTDAMIHSGTVLRWPQDWKHLVVDKHSTGGLGGTYCHLKKEFGSVGHNSPVSYSLAEAMNANNEFN